MSASPVGLYIHVPFCASRCPYCDFYTQRTSDTSLMQHYASAVSRTLSGYSLTADSVYFGGGTPSVLPPAVFSSLLSEAIHRFSVPDTAEITVECNPSSDLEQFLPAAVGAGVNRVSLGMQSAVTRERQKLGRRADRDRIRQCIALARYLGVDNISLDIMLGVPGQTMESLKETLDFCLDTGVPHLSAYMLKLEEGTVFYRRRNSLDLPDEDLVSDMYRLTSETLRGAGYSHYEISNFARPGFEGRHNLKYWRCEEYLGAGPGAHSYLNGSRFYYPRDLDAFLNGCPPTADGPGGSWEERFMLALRLKEGFTGKIPDGMKAYAAQPGMQKFMNWDGTTLRLTPEGFLVSNYLIAELLARM